MMVASSSLDALSTTITSMDLSSKGKESINATIEEGLKVLQAENILEKGDTVVLAGGAEILPGATKNKAIGGVVRL